MGNKKSQRLVRLENELSALGYALEHRYVILDNGIVEASFSTLDGVERWVGCEELRRLGDAGGAHE